MIVNFKNEILFDEDSLKIYLIKSSVCLKLRKGNFPIISLPSKSILEYLNEKRSKYDSQILRYKTYGDNAPFFLDIKENGRRIFYEGEEFKIKGLGRSIKESMDYRFILDNFFIKYCVRKNNRKIVVFTFIKKKNYKFEYKINNKELFNKEVFDFQLRQLNYFSKKLFSLSYLARKED